MPQPDKETKEEKLSLLIKQLVAHRKRPTLLLNMEEVSPISVIYTTKELQAKSLPELDVILNTPGGHIESAYKIVKLLRKHAKKVNIIIPSYAKSAGTLISLAGDTLVMVTTSELGPLDVQIREHQEGDIDTFKSALNGYNALSEIQKHAFENLDIAVAMLLNRTGNRMRLHDAIKLAIEFSGHTTAALYSQLHPKGIAENARSLEVGYEYGIKILQQCMGWSETNAKKAAHDLVYHYPSHSFIIESDDLMKLGFKVEIPENELELMIENLGIVLQLKQVSSEDGQEIKLFDFTQPTATISQNEKQQIVVKAPAKKKAAKKTK